MNKVSIQIKGGLGNMMFQIACAQAYSLKHDCEPIITTDNSIAVHKHITYYKENILKNVNLIPDFNFNNFIKYTEPSFSFNEIPFLNKNIYLDGYFQSEKYFVDYRKEILNLFSFSKETIILIENKYKDVLDKNTCSMHVRRGDYLKYPNIHPSQNVAYYMKALKKMPEDSLCLVFSDDINWCKDNFPDIENKFVFIDGNNDYEDLLLMSLCKNNIICNSSFSWWASWLNKNENKIVISPAKWFGSGSSYDTKDLYCENWIKI
jgi:hypothetical protein